VTDHGKNTLCLPTIAALQEGQLQIWRTQLQQNTCPQLNMIGSGLAQAGIVGAFMNASLPKLPCLDPSMVKKGS
jgi:hypothetical protein